MKVICLEKKNKILNQIRDRVFGLALFFNQKDNTERKKNHENTLDLDRWGSWFLEPTLHGLQGILLIDTISNGPMVF